MKSQQTETKAQAAMMLGYSDGPMEAADDSNPFACKLGGRPLWLDSTSAIPDWSAAMCGHCGSSMIMLVQAYVPLNDSAYDRVIYVWACNQRACTGKTGAAKAVRGHLLNKEYALKLVKRQRDTSAKKKEKLVLAAAATKPAPAAKLDFGSVWRTGGFGSAGSETSAFGSSSESSLFSGPLFGGQASQSDLLSFSFMGKAEKQPASNKQTETAETTEEPDELGEVLDTQLEQLAISSEPDEQVKRVEWPETAAHVPAQYLEFDNEKLSDRKIEERYRAEIEQAMELAAESACSRGKKAAASAAAAGGGGGDEWSDEKYERSAQPKGTDAGFERFVCVTSQNPEQVMRYQFCGEPLLYTKQDAVAQQLGIQADDANDSDESDGDVDDGDAVDLVPRLRRRGYSAENLPRCEHCGGRRVFECQLMPALLLVLPLAAHAKPWTGGNGGARLVGGQLLHTVDLGLEFGTLLVFVCENDCHGGRTGTGYLGKSAASMDRYVPAAYYEELVLVQLENHQY
ncbi:programmed cell death protein 2 [Kickxella alabastrina]|uniref:programmed cell death protein 2 n=1 Tax=Kickxella alabastrina TaxID=61397 RepID=UPI00221F6775|nr:programmed cell death protein 2 [Kickxella alabastrina]KAI7825795.1 programmed cell death protein 2 [Kickxella alabastrina]